MMYTTSPAAWGSLGCLLFGGLVTALGARASIGTRHQALFQTLFLVAFAMVGAAAAAGAFLGPVWYCQAGAVLSVMALAAVWDLKGHVPREAHVDR